MTDDTRQLDTAAEVPQTVSDDDPSRPGQLTNRDDGTRGTGYVGGPMDDAGGAAGMRQIITDEMADARAAGEDGETDANAAQRDR
ncbi:MAG: hypothetical protein ACJ77N_16530 [Chloroflexota bacterium]|jgi:hypothetical protein